MTYQLSPTTREVLRRLEEKERQLPKTRPWSRIEAQALWPADGDWTAPITSDPWEREEPAT